MKLRDFLDNQEEKKPLANKPIVIRMGYINSDENSKVEIRHFFVTKKDGNYLFWNNINIFNEAEIDYDSCHNLTILNGNNESIESFSPAEYLNLEYPSEIEEQLPNKDRMLIFFPLIRPLKIKDFEDIKIIYIDLVSELKIGVEKIIYEKDRQAVMHESEKLYKEYIKPLKPQVVSEESTSSTKETFGLWEQQDGENENGDKEEQKMVQVKGKDQSTLQSWLFSEELPSQSSSFFDLSSTSNGIRQEELDSHRQAASSSSSSLSDKKQEDKETKEHKEEQNRAENQHHQMFL